MQTLQLSGTPQNTPDLYVNGVRYEIGQTGVSWTPGDDFIQWDDSVLWTIDQSVDLVIVNYLPQPA